MSRGKDEDIDSKLEYEEMKYIAKFLVVCLVESCRFENHITEACFDKCVPTLRSKHLGQGEIVCIENCTEKFVSALNRISMRMEDINKELASKS